MTAPAYHIAMMEGTCRRCYLPWGKGDRIVRVRAGVFTHDECPRKGTEPLTVAEVIKALVDTDDMDAIPETEINGVWYQVHGAFVGGDLNIVLDLRPADGQDP